MRLFNHFFVIFKKEFKETFSNPQIIIPSLILPFIMLVILPIFTMFALYFSGQIIQLEQLKENFYYTINEVFTLYFLIVALTLSSIFASSSFVAEKEGQTIETLFYTPVKISDLFVSKILTVFTMVMFIIFLFFILFTIIVNSFFLKIAGRLIFPDIRWLLFIFWFVPAFIFLFISIIVWISSKAKTFIAAQQIAGILIFPIIFLYLFFSRMSNQNLFHFLSGLIIFIFSILFIKFQSSKWKYEKFLK
ncbi:MAG: ABC transporter permease [Brevinematales bacterium]|nr:ABC transporter permease [Brevinematales bacterium]